MAQHNLIGQEGEKLALEYLLSRGYQIRHTNWHSGHYELDIVAVSSDELIIVEVKTRTTDQFETPEQAVDIRKIRRLVFAADHYIKRFQISHPVRFDIITVLLQGEVPRIEHIEDAFYPPVF
ncbi:MAG: YraN family protein [Bacteroidales bacterium]